MLKQSGNAIVWSYDGETLRAEPWGDASVRVRAVKMGKIGQAPDWALLPSENTEIDITETEYEGLKALCLKNGKISVIVQENGRVTILDRNGKKLLQEFVRDRTVRGTDFSALMISAREFMPNPGGGYALKVRFESDPEEKIYGMGQYQQETFNLKGAVLELAQRNAQVSVPFYVSSLGYGFLWNNPAIGEVTFGTNKTQWTACSTEQMDYWVTAGDTPEENAQFLLILTAVLQAVDEYQDLLRISVAGASNDHRLGGSEAPPAILSVFLGDEITGILDSIENGTPYESGEKVQFKVGVHVLPRFPKDTSDRNRTSPFAFTGNKFEFRMVGSSQSISEANIILNTAVADVLRRYADELEGTADFESALHELIKRSIREHRRIIFNGNGYEEAWVREAARRGLCNYRSTPDCVPHLLDAKNAELFRRNRVFSETELRARCEIVLDHYAKEVRIEALTLLDMLRKDVLPAVSRFTGALSATAHEKKKLCGESACRYEKTAAAELSARAAKLWDGAEKLEKAVRRIDDGRLSTESAVEICRGEILPEMETLREISDGAELIMDRAAWPYPSYGEILTSVY